MVNRTRGYGLVVLWGDFNLFVRIPAAQFSNARIPTVQFKSVTKHKSATAAQSSRNYQASTKNQPKVNRSNQDQPGEVLYPASLKEVKFSEDIR